MAFKLTEDLKLELCILDRIIYKNKNQHGRTPYFQALRKVCKLVDLSQRVFPFQSQEVLLRSLKYETLLRRCLHSLEIAQQVSNPLFRATRLLAALLSQTFFMTFALTMVACLARIHVLLMQLQAELVELYNATAAKCRENSEMLAALSSATVARAPGVTPTDVAAAAATSGGLPGQLVLQWKCGLPHVSADVKIPNLQFSRDGSSRRGAASGGSVAAGGDGGGTAPGRGGTAPGRGGGLRAAPLAAAAAAEVLARTLLGQGISLQLEVGQGEGVRVFMDKGGGGEVRPSSCTLEPRTITVPLYNEAPAYDIPLGCDLVAAQGATLDSAGATCEAARDTAVTGSGNVAADGTVPVGGTVATSVGTAVQEQWSWAGLTQNGKAACDEVVLLCHVGERDAPSIMGAAAAAATQAFPKTTTAAELAPPAASGGDGGKGDVWAANEQTTAAGSSEERRDMGGSWSVPSTAKEETKQCAVKANVAASGKRGLPATKQGGPMTMEKKAKKSTFEMLLSSGGDSLF